MNLSIIYIFSVPTLWIYLQLTQLTKYANACHFIKQTMKKGLNSDRY